MSPWPHNAPDPNLIELHGTCLKNDIAWSAGWLHLFGLVQWVKDHLHEHQEPTDHHTVAMIGVIHFSRQWC